MKRYYLKELLNNKNNFIEITTTNTSKIYYLSNTDQILKVFNPNYLLINKMIGINLEKKFLYSETMEMNPAIVKPTAIVLDENHNLIGYTTNYERGKSLNSRSEELTQSKSEDLYRYAKVHGNLKNIIEDSPDIIFPDLCTCENIILNNNDNTIKLIDFDGFQVKDQSSFCISTSLGDQIQYIDSKKYRKGNLFTKELDKKSLTILYFLDTFNVDLNKVGIINPMINQPITLDDLFYCINLDDVDIMQKVWKTFQETIANEYITEEDMLRIADKYRMTSYRLPQLSKGMYLKKLSKK